MDFILKYFCYSILIISHACFTSSNHIKGLDDSILFHINWPSYSESLLDSPDYEKFEMITSNNEKFQCLVPISYGKITDTSDHYDGPNALELLMPLFKKNTGGTCTLRLETFWTYELCHGQFIKQYHEEKDGKASRFQEYLLGITSYEKLEKLAKELDDSLQGNPNPNIPLTKVEGVDLPYYAINYTDGTVCDLTGNARFSRVLYVCYEEGRHAIYSIKETYTCEYEIVIITSLLCQHPAYRPNDVPQTDLHCVSMKNEAKRPKNMLQIEAESLKLRTYGAMLEGDLQGGTIKIGTVEDVKVEVVTQSESSVINKAPFPLQPSSIDKKLVEDFLSGDYCLQGGSGFWNYLFCHGKMVNQFHQDRDGTKSIIQLGVFDIEKHKKWIEKHPSKMFKAGKNQVSHFYSGGDICEETGVKRQVEVKLKCKESDSPNAMILYLLEPKTCEYILGVETPIVCHLLQNVDEFGLFTLDVHQIVEAVDNSISKMVAKDTLLVPDEAEDHSQILESIEVEKVKESPEKLEENPQKIEENYEKLEKNIEKLEEWLLKEKEKMELGEGQNEEIHDDL